MPDLPKDRDRRVVPPRRLATRPTEEDVTPACLHGPLPCRAPRVAEHPVCKHATYNYNVRGRQVEAHFTEIIAKCKILEYQTNAAVAALTNNLSR